MKGKEFIEKAKIVHGDRYDYSKVEYVNNRTKVCIICHIHGEFWQTPDKHINRKQGCPHCSGNAKKTTEKFIEEAKGVHGDRYDYSKVEYNGIYVKVCIICKEHGEFWQTPKEHLRGQGCPECGKISIGLKHRSNTDEFIKKAKKVHGDKYDYSKVEYIKSNKNVIITCPIHGDFLMKPNNHLSGEGCAECNKNIHNFKYSTEEFIEMLKNIHGDKYDYSKTKYNGYFNKCIITCPIHGDIEMLPVNLLKGHGCKKCSIDYISNLRKHTISEFIEKARNVHGDNYDYSEVELVNFKTKVKIKCNKCGRYFYQTPDNHIHFKQGCPHCRMSKLEESIALFLENNNIDYIPQYKINRQRLDFYLPKYNVGIECQGVQHFKPKFDFTSDKYKVLRECTERDIKKFNKCKELGIKLFYYANKCDYDESNNIGIYTKENLFFDKEVLLDIIRKNLF